MSGHKGKNPWPKDCKLGWAIPHTMSMISTVTHYSLMALIRPPGVEILTARRGAGIDEIRERQTEEALKLGCTHIWYADGDMAYPPDTLVHLFSLLERGASLAGGLCYRGYPPFEPVAWHPTEKRMLLPMKDFKFGDVVQARATGCACLLVEAEVFEKIKRPWFLITRRRTKVTAGEDFYFTSRATEAGFKLHVFYVSSSLGSWRSFEREQNRLVEWLKRLPKPVGLMAGNDVCGSHIIEACRIARLQVPDQVAVIGVDNDELICDLTDPPMSSITLNTEHAGYQAAALLDRLMAREKMTGQNILVRATHVVTRQSTDILAMEDRTVAEAIRFIRQHSKEAVQVGDVVDQVAMSRRNLELRFRKALNRSIYSEIKRIRTQQIIRLLCETDLPISEIALQLGHPSDKHIARYFKQQIGMSLKEYRNQCGK